MENLYSRSITFLVENSFIMKDHPEFALWSSLCYLIVWKKTKDHNVYSVS